GLIGLEPGDPVVRVSASVRDGKARDAVRPFDTPQGKRIAVDEQRSIVGADLQYVAVAQRKGECGVGERRDDLEEMLVCTISFVGRVEFSTNLNLVTTNSSPST